MQRRISTDEREGAERPDVLERVLGEVAGPDVALAEGRGTEDRPLGGGDPAEVDRRRPRREDLRPRPGRTMSR
jgi:hypothetical protein